MRVLLTTAIVALTLLQGCSTLSFEPNASLEGLPAAKKTPLHAGVYYSPQFAQYLYARKSGNIAVTVAVGQASTRYFDELFARVFDKTSRLDKFDSEEISAKGIDLVASASLEHFDLPQGFAPYTEQYAIQYRITFLTPNGTPVGSWVVRGTADHWKMMASVGGLTEAYMRDAGTKFINGFERDAGSAMAALAQMRQGTSKPIDAASVTAEVRRRTDFGGLTSDQIASLIKAGFMAVEVQLAANGSRELIARSSDMRLRLQDGRSLAPSSFSSLLEVTATSSSVGAVAPVGVIGLLATLASTANASARAHEERSSQQASAGQVLFGERLLGKGSPESGIVLFRLPEGAASQGATLLAWVVDPATGDGMQVPVALDP